MKSLVCFLAGILLSAGVISWRSYRDTGANGLVEMNVARPSPSAKDAMRTNPGGRNEAALPNAEQEVNIASMADATSTLQGAFATKKLSMRFRLISDLLERIEPAKLGELLGAVQAMDLSFADKRLLSSRIFQKWAEVDPAAATAYFAKLPAPDQLASVDALTSAWASYDPVAALAWAQQLPSSLNRYNAVGLALGKLVEVDAAAAVTAFGKLEPAAARAVSFALYGAWVDIDPQAAVKSALNLAESGRLTDSSLSMVGTRWARNDPVAALNWLAGSSLAVSPLSSNFAFSIISSASVANPQATMEAMMAKPDTDQDTNRFRIVAAGQWMFSDAEAARRWLDSQPTETQAQIIFGAAGPKSNPLNPEAWLPLLEKLPASEARTAAFQAQLSKWAMTQPTDALRYLAQLSDPILANQSIPSVAQGVAKTDPQLAFKMVVDLPENQARQDALSKIAGTWAGVNPVQATTQIIALPDSPSRLTMLMTASAVWAQSNPSGASTWAQNLPAETVARDTTLSVLASVLFKQHPDLALQNAQAIHDPKLRDTVIGQITSPAPAGVR